MHYYLYDSFLNDSKYQKTLHKIENRTVDLGINGKIGRMSMLISPERLVKDEIKKGAKTIIAVGNDKTIDKVISAIAGENVTLGIIPVGKDNEISKTLGIPEGNLACDILSQRRIKKIDLMKVNNLYCLSNLSMKIKDTEVICEDNYKISLPKKRGEIYVYNLATKDNLRKSLELTIDLDNYFNPDDGVLDLVVKSTKKSIVSKILKVAGRKCSDKIDDVSIIPVKKIKVADKNLTSAICDNSTVIKTPLTLEVVPNALSIIVGKERDF